MAHTQDRRSALIAEGKRLVREQDVAGWRLAEIVHELRDDGMTYQAIADELGWKQAASAQRHDRALLYRDTNDFSEAYVLGSVSEDRASAIRAISETEGLTLSATRSQRTPEIKAITAEIADLPNEEKETVARELAHDPGFMAGALAEHAADVTRRQAASKAGETTRPPLQSAIAFGKLRLAVSKVEKATAGIDGDLLDDSGRQSLREQSRRMRAIADYLDALAEGNIDAELEELLS